jgi:uncharacterized membrane protein
VTRAAAAARGAGPGSLVDGAIHAAAAAGAWLLRHWLALFVVAWATFLALPLAAPVLAQHGHTTTSGMIYAAYRLACHQLPQRSFFVGGPQVVYAWPELQSALGMTDANPYALLHAPVRDPRVGYQTALCQRDLAIYAALLLTALVYGVARRGRRIRPLPVRWFAFALVPAALDGGTQLLGMRTSTVDLRLATGALFGMAVGLLVLPLLEDGVRELLDLSAPAGAAAVPTGPAEPGSSASDAEPARVLETAADA